MNLGELVSGIERKQKEFDEYVHAAARQITVAELIKEIKENKDLVRAIASQKNHFHYGSSIFFHYGALDVSIDPDMLHFQYNDHTILDLEGDQVPKFYDLLANKILEAVDEPKHAKSKKKPY